MRSPEQFMCTIEWLGARDRLSHLMSSFFVTSLLTSMRRDAAGSPSQLSVAEAQRVLGVQPGATAAEAKLAYFRLAQHCHPDATPSDTEEIFERSSGEQTQTLCFTEVYRWNQPKSPDTLQS